MTLELKTAHTQFVEHLESRRRAHATIVAYSKDIEQLVSFLTTMGKKDIESVSREELEAFLKKLAADSYTPKSISRKINSMKTFYRFLKTTGAVKMDPAGDIEHPKYEVKPPRILSKLEYRALRDACRSDIRTYAIVELFLQTGLRIGELANLSLADVGPARIIPGPGHGPDDGDLPRLERHCPDVLFSDHGEPQAFARRTRSSTVRYASSRFARVAASSIAAAWRPWALRCSRRLKDALRASRSGLRTWATVSWVLGVSTATPPDRTPDDLQGRQ